MSERVIEFRYVLRELLGRGAQGEVYAAWDRHQDEPVALKILTSLNGDLRVEFATASRVRHPNLVGVRDLGNAGASFYYTMDLVRGVPSHRLRWDPAHETLIQFLAQCLLGLDYLHANDLLHRDLKPGNILVSGSGVGATAGPGDASRCPDLHVRLADYGLLAAPSAALETGGTVEYLAPEVFREGQTASSDLYALGVTVYALLSGQPPPGSESMTRFTGEPSPLPGLDAVPSWLQTFVARLCAPYPEQRFGSASAALAHLEQEAPSASGMWTPREADFLGRDGEVSRAEAAIEETCRQRVGRIVQVVGPPGAGKSRLIEEIVARSQVRGIRTVRCASGRSHPLRPLLVAPEDALPVAEGVLESRVNAGLAMLDRHYRARVLEPTILALGGLPEAPDQALVGVLKRLPGIIVSYPLTVLVSTCRPLLPGGETIELSGLRSPMVEAMVARMTGAAPPLRSRFLEQMMAHSQGLPGRIQGLVQGLAQRGAIRRVSGIWSFELEDLPDSAWDELPLATDGAGALGRLASRKQALLRWAAVLGDTFEEEHLTQVVGRHVSADLASLARLGVLRPDNGGWRFSLPDLHRACLGSYAPEELMRASDRAASVMEPGSQGYWEHRAHGSDDDLATEAHLELAERWRVAGRVVDAVAALRAAVGRAADGPLARHARLKLAEFSLAIGEAGGALELLESLQTRDVPSNLLRCKALVELRQPERAIEEALALTLDENADPGSAADRLHHLANAQLQLGRVEEAEASLEAALGLVTESGDEPRSAQLSVGIANVCFRLGRLAASREAFERARPIFASNGDRARTAVCLNGLGVVALSEGNPRRAVDVFREAVKLQDQIGSLGAQMTSRTNLGLAHFQLGELEQARELYRQASALAQRIGATTVERLRCMNNEALVDLRCGSYESALVTLHSALDAAREDRLVLEEAVILGNIGDVYLARGDPGEARSWFNASMDLSAKLQHDAIQLENLRRHGELAAAERLFGEARTLLQQAVDEAIRLHAPLEAARAQAALGRLLNEAGERAAASTALKQAIVELREQGALYELAEALTVLTAAAEGLDGDLQRTSYEEALSLYGAMGLRQKADALKRERANSRGSTRSKLETLIDITLKLSRNTNLDSLLRDVVSSVVSFCGAARGVLFLETPAGIVQPTIACDRTGNPLDPATPVDQVTVDRVWSTGEPACVADIPTEGTQWRSATVRNLALRTIMCVPLTVEDRRLGVLYVDDEKPAGATFTREDLGFFEALANHAALAIHNQAHRALRRSHQQLQLANDEPVIMQEALARLWVAVEQAAEAIVITDVKANIVYASPAFERITGYGVAEAIGRNPRFLQSGQHDAEFYEGMWETLATGATWHGRIVNKHRTGAEFVADTTITPVRDASGQVNGYVAVQRDVTREISLEKELLHAQKMESVGRLAGSVAHDFNNILTAIMSFAELARDSLPGGHPAGADIQEVLTAANRATGLTRQLLVFSRKQPVQPTAVNLTDVVKGMTPMLQRLIGEGHRLESTLSPDLWAIHMDPTQIEQVVMNLVVNARDSLQGGGMVTIETRNLPRSDGTFGLPDGSHRDDHVLVSVSDDGAGMAEDVQARVFEPFFTTKKQGTGLGLATCHSLVKQAGGRIWFESKLGTGTRFFLAFPRHRGRSVRVTESDPARAARAAHRILVVEDFTPIRAGAVRILRGAGYTVLEADNGIEGLRAFRQHGAGINLILTDYVMPGMGGGELIKEARALHPGVRALVISGFLGGDEPASSALPSSIPLLEKPFTPSSLLRAVQEVLDGSQER